MSSAKKKIKTHVAQCVATTKALTQKAIPKIKFIVCKVWGWIKCLGCFLLLIIKGQAKPKISIPPSHPEPKKLKRKQVALVLSGGASRGAAHCGVIEVLQDNGIEVDCVIGTSAGALMGAMHCDDPERDLKELVLSTKRRDLFDPNLWAMIRSIAKISGLSQGHALQNYLLKHLSAQEFKDLKIPLNVIAYDLLDAKRFSLQAGPIAPAVYASCCVPMMFKPIDLYGKRLVDGGVVNPLNIDLAQALGFKKLIIVDLNSVSSHQVKSNLSVYRQCMWSNMHALSQVEKQDNQVWIQPEFDNLGVFGDKHVESNYEAGKKAALDQIQAIKKLIAQ